MNCAQKVALMKRETKARGRADRGDRMTHLAGQEPQDASDDRRRAQARAAAARLGAPDDRLAAVPLRRLLGVATLTALQAAHIAAAVLGSLDGDDGPYGAFDASDVLIDADGRVQLAERDGEFVPGTARAAGELLGELARNGDRPAAHRRPEDTAMLVALRRCAGELARGNIAAPLAKLYRELEASGANRERLAGELAALVAVPLVRIGAAPQSNRPSP
jgi:hypothetical protein